MINCADLCIKYTQYDDRGIAQLVEHRSPKPSAVGSIPTAPANAAIAQSVECILGKDEVTSSNLVSSSTLKSLVSLVNPLKQGFFCYFIRL